MFVLVILNKGFKEQNRFLIFAPLLTLKESAISTGLFSFVLAQVTRDLSSRVETFVRF